METMMIDDETMPSEFSNDKKCEEEHYDNGKRSVDQNFHQVYEKFSELMMNDNPPAVEINLFKGQRSKNECMFCASKYLVFKNGEMLCSYCYTYQIKPTEIRPPTTRPTLTPIRKERIWYPDGTEEIVEIPKGTCLYCFHTNWLQIANEKICSFCHRSETRGYLIHLDQKQLD